MNSGHLLRAGRIIGVLIFIQMAGGILVNFVLEKPLFGSPGFLLGAASHAGQLGIAVVIGLIIEGVYGGIAITAFPVLRPLAPALTLWLVVLAGVVLAVAVVENAAVLSMVSMSQAYAGADPAGRAQLQALRTVVASARNWPHVLGRIFDGITIFTFYAALYRATVVPRLLAVFGLLAAMLQIAGVGMPLFGRDVVFPMLLPLGLSQLVLALWLVARGFQDPALAYGPHDKGATSFQVNATAPP